MGDPIVDLVLDARPHSTGWVIATQDSRLGLVVPSVRHPWYAGTGPNGSAVFIPPLERPIDPELFTMSPEDVAKTIRHRLSIEPRS